MPEKRTVTRPNLDELVTDKEPSEVEVSRGKGRKVMKELYEHKTPKISDYVGKKIALREKILGLSLFPNLYNSKIVMSEA